MAQISSPYCRMPVALPARPRQFPVTSHEYIYSAPSAPEKGYSLVYWQTSWQQLAAHLSGAVHALGIFFSLIDFGIVNRWKPADLALRHWHGDGIHFSSSAFQYRHASLNTTTTSSAYSASVVIEPGIDEPVITFSYLLVS